MTRESIRPTWLSSSILWSGPCEKQPCAGRTSLKTSRYDFQRGEKEVSSIRQVIMLEVCHAKMNSHKALLILGDFQRKLKSRLIFGGLSFLKVQMVTVWSTLRLPEIILLMQRKHNVENPNGRSTIDNLYLFLACITKFWQEIYIRNYISLWLMLKWLRFLSIGRK